ncbi:MAG: cache domain-containing protein [Deltaproteobacteria bacterium]|nr:cache domain-containing protein [Deltaproteobacteria bacterium]
MLQTLRRWFQNHPIRYKLLATYSVAFTVLIATGGTITYSLVRKTIEHNIESELTNSTSSILNLVNTSASASIRSYLRAIADQDLELVEHLYAQSRRGELSDAAARERAAQAMLLHRIGKTGYVCCLDSRGVMLIHPKKELLSQNLSEYAFVRDLTAKKRGYLEYDWKNPDDQGPRPKAMYMAYFAPWDWIILASAYRDEFTELVKVEDFRESVLSLKFGKTGYAFIADTKGNVILHPKFQGANLYRQQGVPTDFFAEMLQQKSGKILYYWKNPGEPRLRQKLVIYNRIPQYDWIVGSASYLDEVYAPLRTVRTVFALAALGSLLLVLPLTLRISASITSPLQELTGRLAAGADRDLPLRLDHPSRDEVGLLTAYFNAFLARLDEYSGSLKAEIAERKQAQDALRRSEELFSKAFRSSPNGIAILTLEDGRFLTINETFLRLTGYTGDEVLGHTPERLALFCDPEAGGDLLRAVGEHGQVRDHELEFRTKAGDRRLGRVSGERIEIWDEPRVLATIEDVTEWRRLERELIETGDRERATIGQELHDDLAPHLIGVEVLSKVLQRRLQGSPTPEAAHAEKIRELIGEAIRKTRALARGLCPVHLADNGLELALRELSANEQSVYGVPCDFSSEGEALVDDNSIATQLFYVAREALHNAVKHARASRISVELAGRGERIHLRVADDGVGWETGTQGDGMGLRIMEYRARLIGATLSVESRPGEGTVVHVSVAAGGPVAGT